MNNSIKSLRFNGFTLIEALVSVAIVSIIGLIIVNLLTQTFDSNTKTQLLSTIKQNGQTALNYIDSSVHQANSIVCVGDTSVNSGIGLTGFQTTPGIYTGNVIVLKSNSNNQAIYQRILISPAGGSDPSGSIQVDNPTSIDDSTDYTLCNIGNVKALNGPNLQNIIQTQAAGGLKISSADATTPNTFFTLNRSAGAPDSVQISFALSGGAASTSAKSQASSQIFQTTLSLK